MKEVATMDELEIELETLTSKLKEGAEKISNWTNEEQTKLVLSIAEQGETFLSKFDEEKQMLKTKLENTKFERDKVVEEKRSVLQKLKTELDRQYTLTQELGQKKKKYENEVEDLKDSADKLRKEIESTTEAKRKLEYFNKANAIFSDMLGLSIRKTKGNKMQVIFTQIDEKDPSMLFYFFLQIVNGEYIVSNPEPPLEGLEDQVSRLNETNNLREFMIKIRQKFKDSVKPRGAA